jgi:hypothetical protein
LYAIIPLSNNSTTQLLTKLQVVVLVAEQSKGFQEIYDAGLKAYNSTAEEQATLGEVVARRKETHELLQVELKSLPRCRKRRYLMYSHNVHEFDPQGGAIGFGFAEGAQGFRIKFYSRSARSYDSPPPRLQFQSSAPFRTLQSCHLLPLLTFGTRLA